MSEARFESIAQELRAAAPPAPERLRGLVRTLPSAQSRLAIRVRPALSAAIAIAIAVGLGAALIGGLKDSRAPSHKNDFGSAFGYYADGGGAQSPDGGAGQTRGARTNPSQLNVMEPRAKRASQHWRAGTPTFSPDTTLGASSLSPGSRLQSYAVAMNLRVPDLSRATQTAVRRTRRLGGYVAAADYLTGANTGDSRLDLRIPVQHVQQAIAGFTDLGTILSQHISVGDLQAPLDRTDARIAALRKVIAELEKKNVRTPTEQIRLDGAKRTLRRLTQTHSNLVREGTYAKISLQLTTRKPAAQHVAPGRFSRFWGDAGDILGKEAIGVLYALVVVGPFAILAAIALFGGRARRRRADHRLLEETG